MLCDTVSAVEMKPGQARYKHIPVELHGDGRFVFPESEFVPAYIGSHKAGALKRKATEAIAILRECALCPRRCGVNRLEDKRGVCGVGRRALVSSAFPHLGEEDCLRGWRGSGTIFFSGCNLRCVFCQNCEISQLGEGEEVTAEELAGLMLKLQAAGCHNINFVTPTHVVPQILEALVIAVEAGLRLPLVYNTGGYDSEELIRLLDGVVDIYMPDFKLWTPDACAKFLTARDYADAARKAIKLMHEQVGVLRVNESGLALRGVLIRHLVMPGMLEETAQIMRWLATELSPDTFVNVMDQYRPEHKVLHDPQYAAIGRRITNAEFNRAIALAKTAGLWRFDTRWRNVLGVLF
ncbi:MAG: radical SAM protein [Verrucomicrobiae bacterium]|nr:radical SAM protein [Verrucomicrobiae bacterium]